MRCIINQDDWDELWAKYLESGKPLFLVFVCDLSKDNNLMDSVLMEAVASIEFKYLGEDVGIRQIDDTTFEQSDTDITGLCGGDEAVSSIIVMQAGKKVDSLYLDSATTTKESIVALIEKWKK